VPWQAVTTGRHTTLTTAAGTGSGTVRWSRQARPLGVHVDTITVAFQGLGTQRILDTMVVKPIPVALTYTPTSRTRSAFVGDPTVIDSVRLGVNYPDTGWVATAGGAGL